MHDPTLSLVKRGRLGRGVADRYLRGRHVDAADSTVLSGVTQTRFYYPPYSFDCPLAPRLQARLQITENVLVARSFDEVDPEVLLEELHTACELGSREAGQQTGRSV